MGRHRRVLMKCIKIAAFVFGFICLKLCVVERTLPTTQLDLLKTVQNLEETQFRNVSLLVQDIIISETRLFDEINNRSRDESDEEIRKTTRRLFDDRPIANYSNILPENHPYFPGYIIENPDVCKDEAVDILVYLHSSAENVTIRRNLRESWCNSHIFFGINLKVIFIVGRPSTAFTQFQIESEYAKNGDIIQGNISDTVINLTYKSIIMLAWVNKHCPNARYILKVDDDMFVDMYRVVSELIPKLHSKQLSVACIVRNNIPVIDNAQSRWYVSGSVLAGRKFWPTHCSGHFVVITGETIPKLYEASFDIHEFIPFDDVYLFGVLPEKSFNLQYLNIDSQISVTESPHSNNEIRINGKSELISFRVSSYDEHTKLWSLRSRTLSRWEQVHSNYVNTFRDYEKRSVQTF